MQRSIVRCFVMLLRMMLYCSIGAIISVLVVLVIDLINLNQLSQPDGQRIIDIYLYGPITITTTVVLGYLGSLFGPELPIEKVREYTLIKK